MRGGIRVENGYQPGAWRYPRRSPTATIAILKRLYSAEVFQPLKPLLPWPERQRWRGRRTCPHVLGHRFNAATEFCERCGKARAYATTKMRPMRGMTLMDLLIHQSTSPAQYPAATPTR